MKFKYYLRGAGVGILVTTLIFVIALALHSPDISDDEIISRAKQLGMVMAEDSTDGDETISEEDTTKKNVEDTDADNNSDADAGGDTTPSY